MIKDDSLKLDKILNDIILSVGEIRHIAVIDRTGFLVRALSRDPNSDPTFIDKLGLIGQAMFQAGESPDVCMDFGDISIQITEYSAVFLIGCSIGAGIMVIAADKDVKLDVIRFFFDKYRGDLDTILRSVLGEEAQKIPQDLKALLGSEFK